MTFPYPDLYDAATRFLSGRNEFSARRFQQVLRVGFVMRDRLLIELESNGRIKRLPGGRYRVTTKETP